MYTYENRRPWRLAVLKSLPSILFFFFFSSAYGQQVIPLINPSLEGPTGASILPAPWYAMDGTPDTEINNFNVFPIPASNGNNYVRMVCDEIVREEMACELVQQLDSGRTYEVSFDLAMENSIRYPVVWASFQIHGNRSKNEKGEVLWQSGAFNHKAWKRYTAVFKPLKNYQSITFSPYYITSSLPYSVVVTYVDNFSPITETFMWNVDVKNACPGQNNGAATVNFPDPGGAYSYYWTPTGATTKNIKNLPAGTYTVTVTSAAGLSVQKEIVITTTDMKASTLVTNQTCNGVSDASLDVTASGGTTPYRYFINGDANGQEDHVFRNISPGNYEIAVTDVQGCTISENVFVKEVPPLQIENIETKPTSCNSTTDGQIILSPAGGTPPFTYRLSPDRTQSDSIFRRLDAGIYKYLITDKNNCTLEGNAEVKREWRECAVFIPTAFSPNNDGKNELFRAKVQDDISEFRMAVYGRWGQLIFESNNPDKGWDGKLQGTDMPAGSYMWVITYKDRKQQHMQQQGSVLLVR